MKRMIVYKSCSYVIMALLLYGMSLALLKKIWRIGYGLIPLPVDIILQFLLRPRPVGDTGWRNVER